MEKQQIKKNEKHVFRIPILKKIDKEINKNEDGSNKAKQTGDLRDVFFTFESKLFNDIINPFGPSEMLKNFSYGKQKGFFGFYNTVKQWLSTENLDKDKEKKLEQDYNLDKPYKLARQVFCEYFSFIKDSKNVKVIVGKDGVRKNVKVITGEDVIQKIKIDPKSFVPDINDFFTEEELIELGGNEFIKDCYDAIKIEETKYEGYKLKNKIQIQNVSSGTKDENIEKLNNEEKSVLQKAIKNEGFWKHLEKSELKILPFTCSVALILVLVGGCAFPPAYFEIIMFLADSQIVVGALFIAPILAFVSRKFAIVNNAIKIKKYIENKKIDDQNKEFNDKLTKGENEYKKYKTDNPNFLTSELAQEKNIEKEENIIENKIIPKVNENNQSNNPFKEIEDPNNNNPKKENKEPS